MLVLIILDGWGLSAHREGNALALARTPTSHYLAQHFPTGILSASGPAIGLAQGEAGNSEIGHLTIGTGQNHPDPDGLKTRIDNQSFSQSRVLGSCFQTLVNHKSRLHLIGLLDSHNEPPPSLVALIQRAKKERIGDVFIHLALDGQDSGPHEGLKRLRKLNRYLKKTGKGKLVSLMGSNALLDPNGRRTESLWRMLVEGKSDVTGHAERFIKACYTKGMQDDEIPPTRVDSGNGHKTTLERRDAVVFFSGGRGTCVHELSQALTGKMRRHSYSRNTPPVRIVHLVGGHTPPVGSIAFSPEEIQEGIGQRVSEAGMSQVRIAETLKAPHITHYFNGGTPKRFKREERVLIDSGDLTEHDRAPKMAAHAVTAAAVRAIHSKRFDLLVLNYANTDLVGHTGNLKAAIKAVETVEECLAKVLAALDRVGGKAIVTSDHGNCETMLSDTGTPHRAHTSNNVPFNLVSLDRSVKLKRKQGTLRDIAPTVLTLLGLEKSPSMTGDPLL